MSFTLIKPLFVLALVVGAGYAIFYSATARDAFKIVKFKPLILTILVILCAYLFSNLLLLHIVFFLVPHIFSNRKEEVGSVYIVGLLITPPFQTLLAIGSFQLFPYNVHHSLALGALIALTTKPGRLLRWPLRYDAPAFFLLSLLFFVATRETSATNWIREIVSITISYGIPYIVISRSLVSIRGFDQLRLWLIATMLMLSAVALFEISRGWNLYLLLEQRYGTQSPGILLKFRGGLLRAEGPFPDQTVFGFVLAIGFALILFSKDLMRSRAAHLVATSILLLALLAPQSRGAWLGAAVAAFAGACIRYRGQAYWIIAAGFAIIGMGFLASPTDNKSAEAADTMEYRSRLFERGVQEFWKHPIIGQDRYTVEASMADMEQGEHIVDFVNSHLFFALTGGVIGLAMFVLSFLAPFYKLSRIRSTIKGWSVNRDALFSVLISCMAMFAFTSFIERMALLSTLVIGLSMRLAYIGRLQPCSNMSPIRRDNKSGRDLRPIDALDLPNAQ